MVVVFHKSFRKKYRKVSILIQRRFKERRDLFLSNPSHPLLNTHPLTGDRKGQWSISVTGDWRAIYIFMNEKSVVFIDLDTHSNLYK